MMQVYVKFSVLLLMMIFLTGCFPNVKHREFTGCNHDSGWCDQIRELAQHSWPYAQLSYNVYNESSAFDTGDRFTEVSRYENPSIGFYAVLYEDSEKGTLVFVIRGTEDWNDWKNGNLLKLQNDEGLSTFRKIQVDYPGRSIIVAGHSLGGGIAMHISLYEKVDAVYSFNGSPHFWKKGKDIFDTPRFSIVEYGEILKFARIFGREATQVYTSIGCSDGNSIAQHSQLRLATCLTQIAATEDALAAASLSRNKLEIPKWLTRSNFPSGNTD